MSELNQVIEKYKNQDLIYMKSRDVITITNYFITENGGFDFSKLEKIYESRGSFVRFIDNGVLLVDFSDLGKDEVHTYPFEINDDVAKFSILLWNPFDMRNVKVGEATLNRNDRDIHYSYNESTAKLIQEIFISYRQNVTEYNAPDDVNEWMTKLANGAILKTLTCHLYLVLHEKNLSIQNNRQERTFKKGTGNKKKRIINPMNRYIITIPNDYKPRKFDLNYLVSEWSRCGHTKRIWVKKENLQSLKHKHGSTKIGEERNGKVQLEIYVKPTECHRRVGNPIEARNGKLYGFSEQIVSSKPVVNKHQQIQTIKSVPPTEIRRSLFSRFVKMFIRKKKV